jgi:hypothetical protein
MTYPPSQKPPIWSIDPGVIAYNCQKAGIPHPVLAMPMWEGAGNLARDYSGHGNHGTLTGAPEWRKDGLDFNDVVNDRILIDHLVTVGPNKYTLSFWVRPSAINTYNMVVGQPGQNQYLALRSTDYLELHDASARDLEFTNLVTWQIGTQYHILITYDTDVGEWHAWVDGVDLKTLTDTGTSVFEFNEIGRGWLDAHGFPGIIDQVQIYNDCLFPAQIKFTSNNPYFMYQIPEELYGYVAGAPPTGNPFWYYNMLRRRN